MFPNHSWTSTCIQLDSNLLNKKVTVRNKIISFRKLCNLNLKVCIVLQFQMLKVITLVQSQTDNINQMITRAKLTSVFENKKNLLSWSKLICF